MELRNFILQHNNWEELLTAEPYCLKISRKNNYIMFKYSQIDSDFNLPIVKEARGVIFYEPTWEVVCRGFDKFGNYGESYAANIDWSSAIVKEKIDGSLIKVWFHAGEWHISTNGTIDATDAETGNLLYSTYYQVFAKAANYNLQWFEQLDKNYTYCFELVSPITRVVVPYEEFKLYFLEKRNNLTEEESFTADFDLTQAGIATPISWNLNSLEETINCASHMPWNEEGFVVADKNFNRIKVKSPAYILAHYTRGNGSVSIKRLVEVILRHEEEEFLIYADEYKEDLLFLKERMRKLQQEAEEVKSVVLKSEESYMDKINFIKNFPTFIQKFLFDNLKGKQLSWEEYTSQWTLSQWVKNLE